MRFYEDFLDEMESFFIQRHRKAADRVTYVVKPDVDLFRRVCARTIG